jgi:two-component system nitrate/nitrite response regulator NarL
MSQWMDHGAATGTPAMARPGAATRRPQRGEVGRRDSRWGTTRTGGLSEGLRVRPGLSLAVGQRPALQLDAVSRELAAAGFELRCAATTCRRLIRVIARRPPVLALVHAALDPSAPLGFVPFLREVAPEMAIVVLFDDLNPTLAHAAVAQGVDGVVLGDSSVRDLALTLQRVAAGEAVYPAGWLGAARRADSESIEGLLSDRQRDVLELLAAGFGNSLIAESLHISPNTVKVHVRQIYQRLGVKNRVEATLLLQAERRANGSPADAAFTT